MSLPTYWDIWNYHGAGGTGNFAYQFSPELMNTNGGGGGEAGSVQGVSADIAAYHNTKNPWLATVNGTGEGTQTTNYSFDESVLPDNLKGIVSGLMGTGGGDDQKDFSQINVDYSKLPKTKFGSLKDVALVDPHTELVNPALQYYDENYGQITPSWNIKEDKVNKIATSAMMAVATSFALGPLAAALGGGALGTAGTAAFKALGQGMFNGGKFDIGSLLGAAASATGIPGAGMLGPVLSSLFNHGGKDGGGSTGSPTSSGGGKNPLAMILALAALAGKKPGKPTGG